MSPAKAFAPKDVWSRLDPATAWEGDWFDLTAETQFELNTRLKQIAPFPVEITELAKSFEGRPIPLVRMGGGKRRVLIWARQHGNEPECSAALNTVLFALARRPEDPVHRAILEACELLVIPNVNPDGTNAFTRFCAPGIDLNREAQALAMPEARNLVHLKDEYRPHFSFNLHDMVPRKAREGDDPGLISMAFQAGPIDEENNDNDARLRAKTIIGHMFRAAEQVTPKDSICRYKAYYMNRGFGDSMNRWGVPCVLIESGSWHADQGGDDYVIRLHALALMAGLYHFALGHDEPFDDKLYEEIPFEVATYEFDGLYRDARILDAPTAQVFRGDLGWQKHLNDDRTSTHRQYQSRVQQAGDLSEEHGVDQRRLPGRVIVPGLVGVAPHLVRGEELPTFEQTQPWVRAGFTTLAVAFGPFADASRRDRFVESAYRKPAPINIAGFERVDTIEAILQRCGVTPFRGMVVTGLMIAPQALLETLRRFHPPLQPSLRDLHGNAPLGLDLFFTASSSPRGARLLLCLHAPADRAVESMHEFEPSLLENLIERHLAGAEQLGFAWAGGDRAPDFLPAETAPVGFAPGIAPRENFLAQHLRQLPEAIESATAHMIKFMSQGTAQALGLAGAGTLRHGARADAVVLPEKILTSHEVADVAPEVVVLNGEVAIDRQKNVERDVRGIWTFA